jgi:peptidoglycan/LPS O-acetylase OafA/YrhL
MERNRVIDGWRGVCVLFVIIDHLINFRFVGHFRIEPFRELLSRAPLDTALLAENIALRFPHTLAQLAVNVFLVISGYLITTLLLKEYTRTGSINFQAFYVRRFFRIVPTFYAFILVTFVLSKTGAISVAGSEFLSAGAFLCNTALGDCQWWFGHTYTLSIQEQFYIFWPLVIALIGRRFIGPVMVILFAAFLVMSFFDVLSVSWMNNATYFASIAAGALYASSSTVARVVDQYISRSGVFFATILILFQPFIVSVPVAAKVLNLGTPAAVAILFFGSLRYRGRFSFILSNALLCKIGMVSYSLYMWQQLFLGRPSFYSAGFLNNPILLAPCVLLSYVLIERPMTHLGHQLSSKINEHATPKQNVKVQSG